MYSCKLWFGALVNLGALLESWKGERKRRRKSDLGVDSFYTSNIDYLE